MASILGRCDMKDWLERHGFRTDMLSDVDIHFDARDSVPTMTLTYFLDRKTWDDSPEQEPANG